jgi:hypothetical protein
LEITLTKILQIIFGPEKFPVIPTIMSNYLQKIPQDIQNIYAIIQYIERITKRPNGRGLFNSNITKAVAKNSKFKYILPTPIELARIGFKRGWIKPVDQKMKETKVSTSKFLSMKVKISSLKMQGSLNTLLKQSSVFSKLWINFGGIVIESRQNEMKSALSKFEKQAKISAGEVSGKQKYGSTLKNLRNANRWLTNVIMGGKVKMFASRKDLHQLAQDTARNLYPSFKSNPENFVITTNESILRSLANISQIAGDFQGLIQYYAALWVADSEYIEKRIDDLFWTGITKTNGNNNGTSIDRKINTNLKTAHKKETKPDKKTIIREALIEDIVPAFNKIVRIVLANSFTNLKDDRVVAFDEKNNDWYVSLGRINVSKIALNQVFSTIENISLEKISDDVTEVRYILTSYYSLKRSKESQTLEEFIRKATFNQLGKNEVKALEFFNDLNEKYIGKTSAETLHSYIRSLAQLIIAPMD